MNIWKLHRHDRQQAESSDFQWTMWMAAFGLFLLLLYVIACMMTNQPIVFYGS